MKTQRQAVIVELVNGERISRQELLRQRLLSRGFDVTQATLSRDIKELGLVKRASDGAYQRPDADNGRPRIAETSLRRTIREFLRSCEPVQHLIVLKTDPGRAQILAVDIDRAGLPEVAGTIGGDDTILVVVRDASQAGTLAERFRVWAGISAQDGIRHQGSGIRGQGPGISSNQGPGPETWPKSLARRSPVARSPQSVAQTPVPVHDVVSRVLFAFSGDPSDVRAVQALAAEAGVEVATLTLDLGQREDLDAVREQALEAGAVRAHVIDGRDALVTDLLLPALRAGGASDGSVPLARALCAALIARWLADVADMESAPALAHGSLHDAQSVRFVELVEGLRPG